MRLKLKTIEYYGVQSEEHSHDLYVKVMLFPEGTKRKVKVLLLPSFKVVDLIQIVIVEDGYTPTDGIHYALNRWKYES